tara:strand:+ start:425 stop:874 length:450 start_codon:yes stop_codon:yes gene_type:complete
MKKIILVTLLFVVACSTANYNTPFINVTETKQLDFGMTQDEVLDRFGQPPLFVESGGNGEIVWVYEVRTISVRSDGSIPDIDPNKLKEDNNRKHNSPIHKLEIVFKDFAVKSWGIYNPHTTGETTNSDNGNISNDEYLLNGTITVKEKN